MKTSLATFNKYANKRYVSSQFSHTQVTGIKHNPTEEDGI